MRFALAWLTNTFYSDFDHAVFRGTRRASGLEIWHASTSPNSHLLSQPKCMTKMFFVFLPILKKSIFVGQALVQNVTKTIFYITFNNKIFPNDNEY